MRKYKKILADAGIIWHNPMDLIEIIHHTNLEHIRQAANSLYDMIMHGKKY